MMQVDFSETAPVARNRKGFGGNQAKWHAGDQWFKADLFGYEALAEVLVSELLSQSNLRGITEFVLYAPVQIQYRNQQLAGCVSSNFRAEYDTLLSWERLHRICCSGNGLAATLSMMGSVLEQMQYTVEFVENTTGLSGVGRYLTAILEADAFFLNEDRHTNNLALLRNEDTGQFRLCPVFDNGLALLSDLQDYPLDQDVYSLIDRVSAKPFSADFSEQLEAAWNLYGPQLRFSFSMETVSECLSALADLYPRSVLSRVETVLREQKRKYAVLF